MSKTYWPLYEVFVRSKQGLSHRHVGSLHAADDQMALENARDAYTRRSEGCSIWVVKASEIVASQPEERGEFFDPALWASSNCPSSVCVMLTPSSLVRVRISCSCQPPSSMSTATRRSTPCRTAWNICEATMTTLNPVATYALRLGDNGLILAQRLGAWCGHAPELEIDLALANIGLDLLGQARNFLSYAAELNGSGDEDTLAFGRDERLFSNLLLVEQPNGNFADTIARQFFIDIWHVALFSRLVYSRDAQLAAIAAKGLKEVRYHQRFSRGWLERLGNGTDYSAQLMQQAVDNLWRYTGELFVADALEIDLSEQEIAVDPRTLQAEWQATVHTALLDSGLQIPQEAAFRSGGKQGLHSEHLGPMLAEMQYLQRSYPGQQW